METNILNCLLGSASNSIKINSPEHAPSHRRDGSHERYTREKNHCIEMTRTHAYIPM